MAHVGEFLWYLRGELNTPLCLNIKEVNEQCFGQSHHNMHFYMESAKMHHKQIPYVHSTKPKIICMGQHLSLWIHPSTSSAAQFAPELGSLSTLIPGWLQNKAETVSYHQGKLHSLGRSVFCLWQSCFQSV